MWPVKYKLFSPWSFTGEVCPSLQKGPLLKNLSWRPAWDPPDAGWSSPAFRGSSGPHLNLRAQTRPCLFRKLLWPSGLQELFFLPKGNILSAFPSLPLLSTSCLDRKCLRRPLPHVS